MPDNPSGPGSAAASAGSQSGGQGSTAGGAAGSSNASRDPHTERLEALTRTVESSVKEQANFRSLVDRQLNELRSTFQRQPVRSAGAAGSDPNSDPGSRDDRRVRMDPYFEQELALVKFRQLNSDWNDYWTEMEPILQDQHKAAPYVVQRADPETGEAIVDYYASLQNLRDKLELERLRKRRTEFDEARRGNEQRREDMRRQATISGGGSAPLGETVNLDDLSPEDMVEKGLLNDFIDPNDPPRGRRR